MPEVVVAVLPPAPTLAVTPVVDVVDPSSEPVVALVVLVLSDVVVSIGAPPVVCALEVPGGSVLLEQATTDQSPKKTTVGVLDI